MAQYIDKAAVVAEIEKRIKYYQAKNQKWGVEGYAGRVAEGKEILDYINTLEVKESEDERIRKGIIGFLKTMSSLKDGKTVSNEDFDSVALLDWAAWLEKQGEQKPTWSEEDEKFFKTALWHISHSISNGKSTDIHCDTTDWLKALKERMKGGEE